MDPKTFWEEKIIGWEDGRYNTATGKSSILERLADQASTSLRFRLEYARTLLLPHVPGKKIVEIGCGSGFLTPDLISGGAKSYIGYDIAASALVRAKDIADEAGISGEVEYVHSGLENINHIDADIVFSLGLLDWLNDGELEKLFSISGQAQWLHAIAEKRFSASQWVHRLYVQLSYGYKSSGYIPRYYKHSDIEEIAKRHCSKPITIHRDRRLSFGLFMSTLA